MIVLQVPGESWMPFYRRINLRLVEASKPEGLRSTQERKRVVQNHHLTLSLPRESTVALGNTIAESQPEKRVSTWS